MPRIAFIFLLLAVPVHGLAADAVEEGDTYLALTHFRGGEHTAGLGGTFHEVYREKKNGVYVSYFVSFSSRDPSYEFLGANSGDRVLDVEEDVTMFNVGASRFLNNRFALYIGGGLGWTQRHARKFDPTRILSDDGIYYVEAGDRFGLNANAGLLYAGEDMMFEAGYNSFGKSYYLGLGFSFEGN